MAGDVGLVGVAANTDLLGDAVGECEATVAGRRWANCWRRSARVLVRCWRFGRKVRVFVVPLMLGLLSHGLRCGVERIAEVVEDDIGLASGLVEQNQLNKDQYQL